MSGPIQILLILAAVCYVMVRRMMGQPAQAKQMLILPAVLMVIGLSQISGELKTPMSVVFLLATAALSVVLGLFRGASVRISQRDGFAFVQYTGLTVALWVVNLVVKFGANFLLSVVDPKDAGGVSNSLLLTLGAGMLVEGLMVLARALRSDHQVIWSAGKDGAPHQTSPFLDNMRRNLTGNPNPNATSTRDYDHAAYGRTDWNNQADYDRSSWDNRR